MRQIFCAGARRVLLHVGVDVALRHSGVHVAGRRLPHQDRIAILAEVLRVGVQSAPLRACGLEAHSSMAPGMVAMPGRTALITSTSGSALASSVGKYAISSSKAHNDGISARDLKRGVNFDDDAVAQRDALARLALDQLRRASAPTSTGPDSIA